MRIVFCTKEMRKSPMSNRGKVEGRIEVPGRRGRRRKQLLVILKETRTYCKLQEEAPDRTFIKRQNVRVTCQCGINKVCCRLVPRTLKHNGNHMYHLI
jgi:hypothetical protein